MQQAFSEGSLTYFSSYGPDVSKKYLGSATGRSCFLAGVAGSLFASSSWTEGGSFYSTASVRVSEEAGSWYLRVKGGSSSSQLWGAAMCVNSRAGLTDEVSWQGGDNIAMSSSILQPASRRCYLTGVWSNGNRDDFDTSSDSVRTKTNSAGRWVIGGTGNARGTARCINVNGSYNEGWTNSQLYMGPLDGVQCALTGVQGRFRTDSNSAGGYMSYDETARRWYLNGTAGRLFHGQCFF